jgi:hypothetical protein
MQSYMQHPDSYFPPATQSYAYASMPATGFRAQNIDDIVYRYSSELDRGTPSIGIYAQDGLWDEEDVSTASIPVPESGQAPTVQRKDLSLKGRSRSGTITTVAHKEEKSGGIWGWAKKSQGSPEISMHRSPEVSKASPKESEIKRGLKKEKSRSRLRGKGRRGELNVTVLGDPNESVSPLRR